MKAVAGLQDSLLLLSDSKVRFCYALIRSLYLTSWVHAAFVFTFPQERLCIKGAGMQNPFVQLDGRRVVNLSWYPSFVCHLRLLFTWYGITKVWKVLASAVALRGALQKMQNSFLRTFRCEVISSFVLCVTSLYIGNSLKNCGINHCTVSAPLNCCNSTMTDSNSPNATQGARTNASVSSHSSNLSSLLERRNSVIKYDIVFSQGKEVDDYYGYCGDTIEFSKIEPHPRSPVEPGTLATTNDNSAQSPPESRYRAHFVHGDYKAIYSMSLLLCQQSFSQYLWYILKRTARLHYWR